MQFVRKPPITKKSANFMNNKLFFLWLLGIFTIAAIIFVNARNLPQFVLNRAVAVNIAEFYERLKTSPLQMALLLPNVLNYGSITMPISWQSEQNRLTFESDFANRNFALIYSENWDNFALFVDSNRLAVSVPNFEEIYGVNFATFQWDFAYISENLAEEEFAFSQFVNTMETAVNIPFEEILAEVRQLFITNFLAKIIIEQEEITANGETTAVLSFESTKEETATFFDELLFILEEPFAMIPTSQHLQAKIRQIAQNTTIKTTFYVQNDRILQIYIDINFADKLDNYQININLDFGGSADSPWLLNVLLTSEKSQSQITAEWLCYEVTNGYVNVFILNINDNGFSEQKILNIHWLPTSGSFRLSRGFHLHERTFLTGNFTFFDGSVIGNMNDTFLLRFPVDKFGIEEFRLTASVANPQIDKINFQSTNNWDINNLQNIVDSFNLTNWEMFSQLPITNCSNFWVFFIGKR
ncbi:MAG: hypothetical protein FWG64_07040 [Firmicutes bacterium]|nr:hypothetical protein [Bacillota bacterium]